MSIFSNPFLSLAGQKERLLNAGKSIAGAVQNVGSALTLGAIPKVTFTGNAVAVKIAQNPAQTAGIIAIAANPSGAVAAAKLAISKVSTAAKSTLASLSPLQKLGVAVAAPIAVTAVIKSPKLQTGIANAPSSLINFGSNIGGFIEKPSISSAAKIAKDNPILTSITALVGVATVAGGVGLAANTIATMRNSIATSKNSQIMEIPTAPAVAQIVTQPQEIKVIQPAQVAAPVVEQPKPAEAQLTKKVAKKKKKKKATKKKKKAPKKAKKKKKTQKRTSRNRKKAKSLKRKKKTKRK